MKTVDIDLKSRGYCEVMLSLSLRVHVRVFVCLHPVGLHPNVCNSNPVCSAERVVVGVEDRTPDMT